MNIQAKFVCTEVTKTESGAEIPKFRAVTGNSPENKSFSKYTPDAFATMTITNPAAHGAFTPGAEYLVTFEPAPAQTAG